jgi:hypothetical protein
MQSGQTVLVSGSIPLMPFENKLIILKGRFLSEGQTKATDSGRVCFQRNDKVA